MYRKIFLAFSILAIVSFSTYAAGAAETMTGTLAGAGTGAAAGAAIGSSVVPGIGTVIGALIGGFIGGAKGHESGRAEGIQKDQQAMQNYYDALDYYTQMEQAVSDTEVTLMQSKANISAYDQALTRWQDQYEMGLTSLESEAESTYSELMNNWQGAELTLAAKGQTGGSGALVAQQAKSQVIDLVGSDLKLDASGGLYGMSLNEFRLDSIAGLSELQQNKQIARQADSIYSDALKKYRQQLGIAEQNVASAKNYLKNKRGITV